VDPEPLQHYRQSSDRLSSALDDLDASASDEAVAEALAAAKRVRTSATDLIKALAVERDSRNA